MVHALSRSLNETPTMLEARLALVERIRRVEHAVVHAEQARVAAALMRGRAHDLGNAVQIVKLSSLELQRRIAELQLGRPELDELIREMNTSSEHAARVLAQMIDATHVTDRMEIGALVSHTVHAAVELARPAFLAPIDLRIDLDDTVHTYCGAEELEAIVLAGALEAVQSSHMTFVVRERVIQAKRWVELIRFDDRQTHDGDYAHMFEAGSLLKVVAECAKAAGGEASLAPGRGGLELVVELPVAGRS